MIRMETGSDHFSVFLDKVLILQHTRQRPLFCINRGKTGAEAGEHCRAFLRAGARAVRRWETVRAAPELLELRFESYFSLTLARKDSGCFVLTFKALDSGIRYFRLRLPVQRQTEFGLTGHLGFGRLAQHHTVAWQRVTAPHQYVPGCLLADQGIRSSRAYKRLEAVYEPPVLLASSGRLIQFQAPEPACRHAGRWLVLESFGLPRELRMVSAATRLEAVTKWRQQTGPAPRRLPDWTQSGLCVELSGGIEACTRKLHTLLDAGIPVNSVLLRDWNGASGTGKPAVPAWSLREDSRHYANLYQDIARYAQAGIKTFLRVSPYLRESDPEFAGALERKLLVRDQGGLPVMARARNGRFGFWNLRDPAVRDYLLAALDRLVRELGAAGWLAEAGSLLAPRKGGGAESGGDETKAEIRKTYRREWLELQHGVLERALSEAGNRDLVIISNLGLHDINSGCLFQSYPARGDWEGNGLREQLVQLNSASRLGHGNFHIPAGGHYKVAKPKDALASGNSELEPAAAKPGKIPGLSVELLLRWIELSAFTMFFRLEEGAQGQTTRAFQENQLVLGHLSRFTRLYSMLRPYRSALQDEYAGTRLPPLRDPLMVYPELSRDCATTQFMLGPDLMIAPALRAGWSTTSVSLPDAAWVHLWSSREFGCGNLQIESPVGYPAVFYKKDSAWLSLFEEIRVSLSNT